ncbi:MAG: protein kinase [Chloroflexi bacterium]|nr:protein kinase [Chloroflexota bacterium]
MTELTWIGKTLGGRYLIEAELGHGGMSTVYKATDPNLRRVVAIKLIHPHLSDNPDFVRRFEAEATAVAQMRHPNIIQVFDFNHEGKTYYIVFEFVPGETLQDQLQRMNEAGRQMKMDDLLKIATSIGNALQYAHVRDIIHRDVKPANVMLNVQGEAILADFGIVKMMGGTQHTATGAVLGTARYMSPEQIKGQRVDARSDIYSYGAMLFEMVGGRPPFDANSAMTLMMMHVNDPVPDVRHVRSDVLPELAAVINKALEKEPDQRYQTMTDLLSDLNSIQGKGSMIAPAAAVGTGAGAGATMLDSDLTELLQPESDTGDSYRSQEHAPVSPTPLSVPSTDFSEKSKQNKTMLWGFAALFVVAAIVVAYFVFRPTPTDNADDGGDDPVAEIEVSEEETAVSQAIPPEETETPIPPTATEEPEATDIPPTATSEPTATDPPPATATDVPPTATSVPPTATSIPPTATSPPPTEVVTQLSVQITGITISGDRYSVSYETVGFTETLPGQHIHFFFDNVAQDQAGLPGSGPWILYGGPRPFTGYGTGDRPGNATKMCALVANEDHTVIAHSGNCVNLP